MLVLSVSRVYAVLILFVRRADVCPSAAHFGPRQWPAGAWWYALRSNVLVSNYIPTRKSKGVAPWTLFTGRQPDGRNVRVLGCLAYYKNVKPANKVAPRAFRALNLGIAEDQPGYVLYDLENAKVVVTPHVRFCETVYPGFSKKPGKGEPTLDEVWSPFDGARGDGSGGAEGDDGPPPPAQPLPSPHPGGLEQGGDNSSSDHQISSDESEETDDNGDDDDDGPPSTRLPRRAASGTRHRSHVTPAPQPPQSGAGDGLISSRLGRRTRNPATTHNVSSFIAVPDSGPYWIYVGSGPERDDSVANFTRELGGPAIVMIDPKIGGYGHDITSPPVEKELMALARDARCLGVIGSEAASSPATQTSMSARTLRDSARANKPTRSAQLPPRDPTCRSSHTGTSRG